jgi:opacity protein-like surface antigen
MAPIPGEGGGIMPWRKAYAAIGRMGRLQAACLLAVLGAAVPATGQPLWWLGAGIQGGLEFGTRADAVDDEVGAQFGGGWYALRLGAALVGLEAEASIDQVRADTSVGENQATSYRARGGFRLLWWEEHDEPWLVPYLRVGTVYRRDRGDIRRDDGFGWYAGAGLDYRISERWFFGPFVTYEQVSLTSTTKTWLFGIVLTFQFQP